MRAGAVGLALQVEPLVGEELLMLHLGGVAVWLVMVTVKESLPRLALARHH